MARKKGLSSISLAQIVAFVGIILAGYFIIGFAKVALSGYQLRETKAELQQEVTGLAQEVSGLEKQIDYVQTDDYVEEAARQEFKMSKAGDKVVAPIYEDEAAPAVQAEPQPQEPATSTPTEPWQAWWELFFDQ